MYACSLNGGLMLSMTKKSPLGNNYLCLLYYLLHSLNCLRMSEQRSENHGMPDSMSWVRPVAAHTSCTVSHSRCDLGFAFRLSATIVVKGYTMPAFSICVSVITGLSVLSLEHLIPVILLWAFAIKNAPQCFCLSSEQGVTKDLTRSDAKKG